MTTKRRTRRPRSNAKRGPASGIPADDLAYYAIMYLGDPAPVDFFRRWHGCLDDARILEAHGDDVDAATGLRFVDLGEGARVRARHYAMLAALRKAGTVEDLGWKVLMRAMLEGDVHELNMTHLALLLRVSAAADADEMGLAIAPSSHSLQ